MPCRFRWVEGRDPAAVTLHLFERDGVALGEVTGPRIAGPAGVHMDRSDWVRPAQPQDAFGAAIRMANRYDCELVISGDPRLWQERWGILEPNGEGLLVPAHAATAA